MEELTRFITSRRAHKAHLTKIKTKIDEITDKDSITETDEALLGSYVDQLKRKRETFTELNNKITILIDDPEELEQEIIATEELDGSILEKICLTERLMKLKITQRTHVPPPQENVTVALQSPPSTSSIQENHAIAFNSSNSSPGNNDNPTINVPASQENNVPPPVSRYSTQSRLPKLILPKFNGNPLEWSTFWDSYRSAVHENASLSDVQKFNYLKAQLSNDAERVIAGLPLTNANYAKGVELLTERFGKPHKIINAHMEALLNLPTPSNRLSSLRVFYDTIENHVRGLEALGKTTETYGDILVPIIQRKLPNEVKRNLARQNGNKEWHIDDLRKAILNEVEILEAGQNNPSECDSYNSSPVPTAAFFASYSSKSFSPSPKSNRPFTKRECLFCKGQHYPNECSVVTDKEKRHAIVRDAKACFNCLNQHTVAQCNSRNRCKLCNRKHHTSLCKNIDSASHSASTVSPTTTSNKPAASNVTSTLVTDNTTLSSVSSLHSGDSSKHTPILLKTAVTNIENIENRNNNVNAHILFDEGSQRSFITSAITAQLDLKPEAQETISLSTFGGTTTSVKRVETATIHVKTIQGGLIPINTIIVPTIAAPVMTYNDSNVNNLPHLKGLTLAHPNVEAMTFSVDLLIGADHYWDIVEDEIIKGPGPTAAKSKIGYLLSGPLPNCNRSTEPNASILHVVTEHQQEEFDLERFWNLESIGVQPSPPEDASNFLQYYQDTSIILEDGRYTAKLPWRPEHPPLPSNEEITRQRTRSMVRRLSTDPVKLRLYNDIIAEQETRGFIERVKDNNKVNGVCHYIPHHAVHKDSATTPIRIVYDCSFKHNTYPSLNDCLQPGPPLLNDLTGILLRFRLHRFGLTTDIEKAFLHVNLHEADRDATRFFWLSNPHDPQSELIVYRFKSVMFGATSSPFILNATINKHLTQYNDQFSVDMQRNLYVDDLVTGTNDEETATAYYKNARNSMSSVGFNLRSWNTNSPAVQELAANDNVLDTPTSKKILGMIWDINADKLRFPNRQSSTIPQLTTKREVLQETAKVFDPLGYLQPVTIGAKILLQKLWQEKLDWDEPLPPALQDKWCTTAKEIEDATKLTLPRRYFSSINIDNHQDTELHVFADASQKAYGAVAYLVLGDQSTFVLAKTRVAPANKELTLPQLELMAALTAARLASYLQEQLHVSNVTFWSDSQIVLHWLVSTKPLKLFIANRIKEIKSLTSPNGWKYCPTYDNPADLLTRGITASQLENSSLWQHGPAWLLLKSEWPSWPTVEMLHLQAVESSSTEIVTEGSSTVTPALQQGLQQLINPSHYSNLSRLLRVTAYVIRFTQRLQKKETPKGSLTAKELEHVMTEWIKNRQHTAFNDEINNLQSKASHRTPLIRQLRLYLDKDGLLRCGGRIHNAPLHENTKFPLLLPSKEHFTDLVIKETHVKQLHAGVNSTLTALRQRYWIPAGRQRVKNHIDHCVTCRKVSGPAYNAPDPPPLPKSRLLQTQPFDVTGVDYTGALYIREASAESKVYVCLFTCAATRAVHLELVEDLTVESFLLAFRRFASRKSLPRKMISDNASTFLCADNELTKVFKSQALKETMARQDIDWQFIPKRAPWYGGFWERLIGLTKSAIKKVLGRASVNLSTLQTIVVEVEAMLNDRPLTYVSSDVNDPEALTPAHLLYGRRVTSLPHPSVDDDEISDPNYQEDIQRKAKRVALLIQHFWRRWRQEYLTSLREFQRQSGINIEKVKVGDVVLIHEDSSRINWKLAVVEAVNRGADGFVRSANVRTVNGRTNRPIARLHPLEVQAKLQNNADIEDPIVAVPDIPQLRRSQRNAAQQAAQRISDLSKVINAPPEDVE